MPVTPGAGTAKLPPRRLQFIHIHCLARLGRRMGAGRDDRAPRSHLPAPSSPPANSSRCARARQRTSPAQGYFTALEVLLPAPPDQDVFRQARSETGTVPPPGQLVGRRRPSQSRHRAPAGYARRQQSRRHPASRVAHQIAQLIDPRNADARVPSACSRPSVARRSGADPVTGCASMRSTPPAAAVAAQLGPLLARPTPGGNSRAATARGHRGNRTLHRPDRQPARRSTPRAPSSTSRRRARLARRVPPI